MIRSVSTLLCAFTAFALVGCHQGGQQAQVVSTPAGYPPPHRIEIDTRTWQQKIDAINQIADQEQIADQGATAPQPVAERQPQVTVARANITKNSQVKNNQEPKRLMARLAHSGKHRWSRRRIAKRRAHRSRRFAAHRSRHFGRHSAHIRRLAAR